MALERAASPSHAGGRACGHRGRGTTGVDAAEPRLRGPHRHHQQPVFRPADRHAGRVGPRPPAHAGGSTIHHRKRRRPYHRRGRQDTHASRRSGVDPQLDLARPRQHHRQPHDLAGRFGPAFDPPAGGRILRALSRGHPANHPSHRFFPDRLRLRRAASRLGKTSEYSFAADALSVGQDMVGAAGLGPGGRRQPL